jgi:hypothetical protein
VTNGRYAVTWHDGRPEWQDLSFGEGYKDNEKPAVLQHFHGTYLDNGTFNQLTMRLLEAIRRLQ